MRLRLADRTITIDSFYVTRTYGGMLEGIPTSDLNTTLIESAKKKIAKLWGERKVHVLTPTVKPMPRPQGYPEVAFRHGEPEMLPKFQCHAWLDSTALTKEGHGSQIVLVWWVDQVESFSIQPSGGSKPATIPELVEEALRGVKWENVAEDYEV